MSKGSKIKNKADDIMLICSAFASDSGNFFFVELRDNLIVIKV